MSKHRDRIDVKNYNTLISQDRKELDKVDGEMFGYIVMYKELDLSILQNRDKTRTSMQVTVISQNIAKMIEIPYSKQILHC